MPINVQKIGVNAQLSADRVRHCIKLKILVPLRIGRRKWVKINSASRICSHYCRFGLYLF
jgi:hypothetical protein